MGPHEIRSLRDDISQDGKEIELTFQTATGGPFKVEFKHHVFTKFINDLIAIGAKASRRRTGGVSAPFPSVMPHTQANLMTGMAIHTSPAGNQLNLVIRLWDMDLPFEVAMTTLDSLAIGIADLQKDRDQGTDKVH